MRVTDRIEECQQRLKEHCDSLCKGPQAHTLVSRANPGGGKRLLSGGDPTRRCTSDLVASHLPPYKKVAQRLGVLGPNKSIGLSIRNGVLL